MKTISVLLLAGVAISAGTFASSPAFSCMAKDGKDCAAAVAHKAKAAKLGKVVHTGAIVLTDRSDPLGSVITGSHDAAVNAAPAPDRSATGGVGPVLYYLRDSTGKYFQLRGASLASLIANGRLVARDGTLTTAGVNAGLLRIVGAVPQAPALATPMAVQSVPVPPPLAATQATGGAGSGTDAVVLYFSHSANGYRLLGEQTVNALIRDGRSINPDGTLTSRGLQLGLLRVVGDPVAPGQQLGVPMLRPRLAADVPPPLVPGVQAPNLAPPLPPAGQAPGLLPPLAPGVMAPNLAPPQVAPLAPDAQVTDLTPPPPLQRQGPVRVPQQVGDQVPTQLAVSAPPLARDRQPRHIEANGAPHSGPDHPVAVYHPAGSGVYRYEDANKVGDTSFHLVVIGINDGVRR